MFEPEQPATVLPRRPSERPRISAAPLQRANYGIPVRQATASNQPRIMDIAPTPPRRAPVTGAAPAPQIAPPPHPKPKEILAKLSLVLLIVGTLIALLGAVRWATAGNISHDRIAVGAVKTNDDKTVVIQFVADDGAMHYLKAAGHSAQLLPGTAVQVAYQPGAADTSAKQVSVVKAAHNLGMIVITTGGVLLLVGTSIAVLQHRRRRSDLADVTPATKPSV